MKKKVIIIAIIVFLLQLIFVMNVFASDYMWSYFPDIPSEFSNYEYRVIVYDPPYGDYKLFVSNEPFCATSSHIFTDGYIKGKYCYIDDIEWSSHTYTTQKSYPYHDILLSTHDIYTDRSLTDVFFSATREMSTIQKTLTQHPPHTQMSPLIRGISPFLIGLLIALVGFSKALQFLFKTLRKA